MRALILALLLSLGFSAVAQLEPVTATLISEQSGVVAGKPFTVGLRLEMKPGWHTYWQNPGDSGLATSLEWELPPGFKAGPIQWPAPTRMVEEGDLVTYGYKEEVLLQVEITPAAEIAAGEVTLKAKAEWLMCEKSCIPGSADLSLTLPASSDRSVGSDGSVRSLFERFRARLPRPEAPPFPLSWKRASNEVTLALPENLEAEFFPLSATGHPESQPGAIRIPGATEPVRGVLATPEASYSISESPSASPSAAAPAESLLKFLLFGLIGGFILNLMPCVLPVIALKIFGFIKQAGEAPAKILRLGLAFVAGIFAWFMILAALIVGLKIAGHELNWAFQFQSPYFLLGMLAIVFVFALNLFGTFEILLPGSANSRILDLAAREGYLGAFLHGVFATLLATPCTAPFLGSALGFAFAQSAPIVFAVFLSIAAGMSLPYLLLSARPEWLQFLPKPGTWMVRLKQFMGFLMMATVLWLLWVIGQQRGVAAVIWAGSFLLGLGVACWIYGNFTGRLSRLVVAVVAAASALYFIGFQFRNAIPESREAQRPYAEQLEEALAEGRTVFVDFTADWCVNCKVNERVVINSEPVQAAFRRDKVIFLKADWTTGAPDITDALKSFGRAAVPFYVIYPAGRRDQPIVLGELLTPKIVLEGLEKAKQP